MFELYDDLVSNCFYCTHHAARYYMLHVHYFEYLMNLKFPKIMLIKTDTKLSNDLS